MINIVTPTTRVENLQDIADSLNTGFPIKWWIILDKFCSSSLCVEPPSGVFFEIIKSDVNATAGHLHRNYVIDRLDDEDWFYSIDDDNILHPDFLFELTDERKAVVVAQNWANGTQRLKAGPVEWGKIDTAQFAVRKSLIGDTRFQNVYEGDAHFIGEIYRKHIKDFHFIQKPLSYYNFLR